MKSVKVFGATFLLLAVLIFIILLTDSFASLLPFDKGGPNDWTQNFGTPGITWR